MNLIDQVRSIWVDQEGRFSPYQPLEHEALSDGSAVQNCVQRLSIILKYLPEAPARILDLGCNTGWFCRALSRRGYECVGVEKGQLELRVARELMSYRNGDPPPTYLQGDLHAIYTDGLGTFDAILCLSVVMYLFSDVESGWNLLNKLSKVSDVMFLEFGGQYSDNLPFTEEDVLDQFSSRTLYSKGRLIGRSSLERPIYRLEKL